MIKFGERGKFSNFQAKKFLPLKYENQEEDATSKQIFIVVIILFHNSTLTGYRKVNYGMWNFWKGSPLYHYQCLFPPVPQKPPRDEIPRYSTVRDDNREVRSIQKRVFRNEHELQHSRISPEDSGQWLWTGIHRYAAIRQNDEF